MLARLTKGSFKFFLSGKGMSFRTGRYFLESAFLGAVTGLVTSAFQGLIVLTERLAAAVTHPVAAFFLPAAGAMAGVFLLARFSHIGHARGTDSAIHAFHQDADIPRTVIPVKSVASVLTVGFGGSAGYEGPVTLLGAACARVVTRLLNLNRHAARILLAAGVGAGIAALFRAPLAGAIFGAEIFYSSSDLEYEAILPSFIAATTSYTLFACFWGWDPLFTMPAVPFVRGLHLLPYLLLAFVVTFGVRFYISLFRQIETGFARLDLPLWVKVAVGGIAVSSLALIFPSVHGAGYARIVQCLAYHPGQSGALALSGVFLAFFAVKALATAFTVGSGGSGGVFAPALVCGGTLGMATGLLFEALLPPWVGISPAEFALVGMAGFLASAIRVPIAAIVMVAEISGNHELLMPAMWVCGVSFWLNNGWTLYRSQVHARRSSPIHGG